MVESEKETGGFFAPSITVLASKGWKGNATKEKCYSKEEQVSHNQTIEECFDKNSLNQSDVINDIFLGFTKRTSLLGRDDLIVEGLSPSISRRAKYFTINVGDKIGPDYRKEQLFLELSRNNAKYDIFVHDPIFFTLNYIPVAFPALSRSIVVNKSESHFYPIVLAEVEELNLPQDPCNEDGKYNFQVCMVCIR